MCSLKTNKLKSVLPVHLDLNARRATHVRLIRKKSTASSDGIHPDSLSQWTQKSFRICSMTRKEVWKLKHRQVADRFVAFNNSKIKVCWGRKTWSSVLLFLMDHTILSVVAHRICTKTIGVMNANVLFARMLIYFWCDYYFIDNIPFVFVCASSFRPNPDRLQLPDECDIDNTMIVHLCLVPWDTWPNEPYLTFPPKLDFH